MLPSLVFAVGSLLARVIGPQRAAALLRWALRRA